jgi:hypothetical protein
VIVSYVIQMDDEGRLTAERVGDDDWVELHAIERCGCWFENAEECAADFAACRNACENDYGMALFWELTGDDEMNVLAYAGPVEVGVWR